jgi:hypothetical protein
VTGEGILKTSLKVTEANRHKVQKGYLTGNLSMFFYDIPKEANLFCCSLKNRKKEEG